jgi:hypothetical protein
VARRSFGTEGKRHGINPWAYVQHILTVSAARPHAADLNDLLPDAWVQASAIPSPAAS